MALGFLTQPLVRSCHALCLLNGDGWLCMVTGLLRCSFQDFRMVSVHEDFIVIAIGVAVKNATGTERLHLEKHPLSNCGRHA